MSLLIPSFSEILNATFLGLFSRSLLFDVFATALRTFCSLLLATFFGALLGFIIGLSARLQKYTAFPLDFLRSIPAVSLFPLFLITFGATDLSRIGLAVLSGTLVILLSTIQGIQYRDIAREEAASVLGASKLQILSGITLYEALPHIVTGLRSAASLCLIVVIVTEMFIGSEYGIGHSIINAQQKFDYPEMYAAIFCSSIFGYLLNFSIRLVERKIIHWRAI